MTAHIRWCEPAASARPRVAEALRERGVFGATWWMLVLFTVFAAGFAIAAAAFIGPRIPGWGSWAGIIAFLVGFPVQMIFVACLLSFLPCVVEVRDDGVRITSGAGSKRIPAADVRQAYIDGAPARPFFVLHHDDATSPTGLRRDAFEVHKSVDLDALLERLARLAENAVHERPHEPAPKPDGAQPDEPAPPPDSPGPPAPPPPASSPRSSA